MADDNQHQKDEQEGGQAGQEGETEGVRSKLLDVSPERKLSITLGLATAILVSVVGGGIAFGRAWHDESTKDAVWRAEVNMRLKSLEDDRCPCREVLERWPPNPNR